jgi:hypothetical protein
MTTEQPNQPQSGSPVQRLVGHALNVLVACESSGTVREAFRKLGHNAWSCDLLPADDGSQHHRQGDCLPVIAEGWDLVVAHPPCTHLAVSGARHFASTCSWT